jgi:hypothetical protein
VTIQIQQTFPHCTRCGIMRHHSQPRIDALDADGKRVLFCTELCRDEYAELFGLSDRGAWAEGGAVRTRR